MWDSAEVPILGQHHSLSPDRHAADKLVRSIHINREERSWDLQITQLPRYRVSHGLVDVSSRNSRQCLELEYFSQHVLKAGETVMVLVSFDGSPFIHLSPLRVLQMASAEI